MRILCLFHRTPWPPDKGDKLRAWHLLQALASCHQLDIGWFVDDVADREAERVIAPLARAHAAIPLARMPALVRGAVALAAGGCLSTAWYRHPEMRRFVADAHGRGIDGAYVFSAPMAQYLMPDCMDMPRPEAPFLADFVDVDSLKWRDYARHRRFSPFSPLYALEGGRLGVFEGAAARAARGVCFVSEAEAARFHALHPALSADRIAVVENGVDAGFFDPALVAPVEIGKGPLVVFTGRMDYPPNVDAVCRFVAGPWPQLVARHPDLRFAIVGARPARAVRRLARHSGVIVTGHVEDVRPWLARAELAVAPMHIARGVQNKLLEAMAMARPVVASPAALEGIDASIGGHLLRANDVEEWLTAVSSLLDDPEEGRRMGERARAWVVERYRWHDAGNRLLGLLDRALAGQDGETPP